MLCDSPECTELGSRHFSLEIISVNEKIVENLQLVIAAYLLEFARDLCIGIHNVSKSSGFESIAHCYH